jgi:tetratricopeptide (TPR) repeat protein
MRAIYAYAVMLLAASIATCGTGFAQVKVWQGTLTLPTYEEGKPDPNPPFDTYSTTQFSYPYTLRKNLTGKKQDHTWRAVFLENEYLKCTVLPDIGGHLYTCVDKISGQPMFYANPSIKKAQIGYRGAWAAFGIEFNFPVSHNWVSMSPVDFAYTANPDGSASIFVGNIDRVYGMQWRVEMILRPGSTLLEERVTLYNRSDVRHRYYWWNNAGIEVWDDSHIEYPMRFAASHGFTEVRRWPIGADGKDLSIIKEQQDGPVSLFVHGSHEPFMGIWNPKTQTGIVHYAEYSDLPAKKIWSWGADAEGLGWRKALSDNNSAYVEVQAGLFRNQETYAFLDPGKTIQFSEFWMPVRKTGGISRANKNGIVFLQSHGDEESAVLSVNEHIPHAQLRLLGNGKVLSTEVVDLSPDKTWSHTIRNDPGTPLTFEVRDQHGKVLLSHTDGKYDWDPESTIEVGPQHTPGADAESEGGSLELGTNQELNGKVVLALETYRDGLQKFAASPGLQKAAGRLAVSLQHYAEAEAVLQGAQKRDTPNAEIAYYLGIVEDGLEHEREAQTAYEIAYRQADFRARAALRIGELKARQGDWPAAQAFLKDAVEAAPLDIRAAEELEAVTRARGDAVQADSLARRSLQIDPTSDFFKEETRAPDLPHLAADPYRVLRVATEYMTLGLYQQALGVLDRKYPQTPSDQSEPESVLPQNHPLVLYYVAYCKSKLGKGSIENWRAAQKLSPNFVFPASALDEVVLNAALATNASDATAHYLMGTLLFSKAQYDLAIEHWNKAKRLAPSLPVLDADLGKAWLHLKNDPMQALKYFRDGVANDPANSEIYVGLDEAMTLTGVSAKERAETLGRYPSISTMPANLVYQLAFARAEAEEYSEALDLLKNRFFPSEEGGVSAAQVLFEIELMQAESEAASGGCTKADEFLATDHPGLEVNGAISQPYLRMAAVAKACQNDQQAQEFLHKAASSKSGADAAWLLKAETLLPASDAQSGLKNLQASLTSAKRTRDTSSYTGWWWYNIGTMEAALNHKDEAETAFKNALLLPDSMMSHHMSRAAMAALAASK